MGSTDDGGVLATAAPHAPTMVQELAQIRDSLGRLLLRPPEQRSFHDFQRIYEALHDIERRLRADERAR